MVRGACRVVPLEAFQIAAEWLQYQLASPIDTGDTTCKCLNGLSNTKYAVLSCNLTTQSSKTHLDASQYAACGHKHVDAHHFSLCTLLAKTAGGLCSLLSPSVVQWDAMTVFTECTVTQIFKSLEEEVVGEMQSNNKTVWFCFQ